MCKLVLIWVSLGGIILATGTGVIIYVETPIDRNKNDVDNKSDLLSMRHVTDLRIDRRSGVWV